MSETYLLGSSEREQDRLKQLLESFGQKRLLNVVKPGMRVLDVGCGPGAVSAALAQAVGPEGQVTGVDMQLAQLEGARHHVAELGLENVTFQVADAMNLPFDDGCFDLVYAKFLVMHLPDPWQGVAEMHRVLAPGGTMFLYEVDAGGSVFWPEGTPTHQAWELTMKVLTDGGSDIHAGRKLYGYMRRLQMEGIRVIPEMTGACASQRRLLKAAKRQIIGLLESLRGQLLDSGRIENDELKLLVTEVASDFPDEFLSTAGMNCWAVKPAREPGDRT